MQGEPRTMIEHGEPAASPAPAEGLPIRLATPADAPAIEALMALAIPALLAPFLTPRQIAASFAVMGLDTQLIADGTYFLIHAGAQLVGCGGWSRRATLYGGNHTAGRDARLLDPATEAARIRAMYTHPGFVRRGIGRRLLDASERAARSEGFTRAVLSATLGGEPLYRACGYRETGRTVDQGVPLVVMEKQIGAGGQ